jgi:hypothetical protein
MNLRSHSLDKLRQIITTGAYVAMPTNAGRTEQPGFNPVVAAVLKAG